MKGCKKEKYGIMDQSKVGDNSRDLTTIQLLDPEFKNKLGESNIEVRKRMKESIFSIIKNNNGKRIAIISHGAAIKFFLQEFCCYNQKEDCMKYKGKFVCPRKMKSPSFIKIIFNNDLENIKFICYEE